MYVFSYSTVICFPSLARTTLFLFSSLSAFSLAGKALVVVIPFFFNVTRMCVPKNSCFLRSPKNFYQSFPHTYPFLHHVCWPNYYRPIPIGVEILIALRWFIHLPLIGRLHFTPEFRFVWNLSFSLFFVAAMQLAKTRSIYLWLALEFFHFNFYLVFATRFLARRIEPPSLYSGDCLSKKTFNDFRSTTFFNFCL